MDVRERTRGGSAGARAGEDEEGGAKGGDSSEEGAGAAEEGSDEDFPWSQMSQMTPLVPQRAEESVGMNFVGPLNQQLMPLLVAGGVPCTVFVSLLERELAAIREEVKDEVMTVQTI